MFCIIISSPIVAAEILRFGMSNSDVFSLQQLLTDLGYDLVVDGIFGQETEYFIRELQKAVGLVPDGLVGQQTNKLLKQLQKSVVAYTVQRGDNLSKLASHYKTTVQNISAYNVLPNPNQLYEGQVLYIPTNNLAVLSRSFLQKRFAWPLEGNVTSGYGYRIHPTTNARDFHAGIDIAAPSGAVVRAAASGKVRQACSLGQYGLAVVLEHGGNLTTWYGHNSKLLVRQGELVKQGQAIALVGQTGRATGPHLDFRIKIGDQPVDPLEWLP